MTVFVALLRAVNVGGTGKLAMKDLVALCTKAGCENVRTYIQSGNVVFESALSESKLKASLEKALAAKIGKPTGVLLRSADEIARVVVRNPFKRAEPNRVIVMFLDAPPPKGALEGIKIPGKESLALEGRELFIHFPDGQGKSKLKVPFAVTGTGRNMNTIKKLAEMAATS